MEFRTKLGQFLHLKLDPPLRAHLGNVYGSVASASVAAAAGVYLHMGDHLRGGPASTIASFLLLLTLAFTRGEKTGWKRFGFYMAFAMVTGLSSAPLISSIWTINPSIVISALLYTCIIFTSFTLATLVAPEGKYLALGGPLGSLFGVLVLGGVLFMRSGGFAWIQLTLGLLLMSAFILYDTSIIIAKFRLGDGDYVWHSLTLFLDLASVFKHILVILAQKDGKRR